MEIIPTHQSQFLSVGEVFQRVFNWTFLFKFHYNELLGVILLLY